MSGSKIQNEKLKWKLIMKSLRENEIHLKCIFKTTIIGCIFKNQIRADYYKVTCYWKSDNVVLIPLNISLSITPGLSFSHNLSSTYGGFRSNKHLLRDRSLLKESIHNTVPGGRKNVFWHHVSWRFRNPWLIKIFPWGNHHAMSEK